MEARSEARLVEQMPAFDIKGTITPVTVLRLYTTDLERIERELHARIAPAPQMFVNAPIVIDVADLAGDVELALASLIARLRAFKLIPIGMANVDEADVARTVEAGLAIVQIGSGRGRGVERPSVRTAPPAAVTPAPAPKPARQESRPRAQARRERAARLYAHDQAAGARRPGHLRAEQRPRRARAGERGRAGRSPTATCTSTPRCAGARVAGAQGLPGARVFCQKLEAELVAVARRVPERRRDPGRAPRQAGADLRSRTASVKVACRLFRKMQSKICQVADELE